MPPIRTAASTVSTVSTGDLNADETNPRLASTSTGTGTGTGRITRRSPDALSRPISNDVPEHYRRLLAQRRLWGVLATCQLSHRGQTPTTDMLDGLVDRLSEELEGTFAGLWAEEEPEVLVAEAAMLHDPAAGPLEGCGLCHQATLSARRRERRRPAHPQRTRPVVAAHPAMPTGRAA